MNWTGVVRLSDIYQYRKLWTVVYSDGPYAHSEVLFVDEGKFFFSREEAKKWFKKNFKKKHYLHPRVVEVVGFDKLIATEK